MEGSASLEVVAQVGEVGHGVGDERDPDFGLVGAAGQGCGHAAHARLRGELVFGDVGDGSAEYERAAGAGFVGSVAVDADPTQCVAAWLDEQPA